LFTCDPDNKTNNAHHDPSIPLSVSRLTLQPVQVNPTVRRKIILNIKIDFILDFKKNG